MTDSDGVSSLSTVTKYSFPFHEKRSAAIYCHGLPASVVIAWGSPGWRSAYVAPVAQDSMYYRISLSSPV